MQREGGQSGCTAMAGRCALLALLLLAGCGPDEGGNRARAPGESGERGRSPAEAAIQTADLTGLYESRGGAEPSQLCVLDRGTGNTRFGLVLRGSGEGACSGAGAAVRRGESVTLTMEGDEPCAIEARLAGGRLAFPAELPAGCAYYCGSAATMAGAEFAKVGGTAQDAMRARDLVGDPLCAEMGTP